MKAFPNGLVFKNGLELVERFNKSVLRAMEAAGFGFALLDAIFNEARANRQDGAMRAIIASPLLAFLELLERNHLLGAQYGMLPGD
jgi:hypothetical protein